MEGKYFDGKSSKSYSVNVRETFAGLELSSVDGSAEVSIKWDQEGISSESFATGEKVLLSYGEFPPQRLELTGAGAESIMTSVISQESKVKGIQHFITRANPVKLVIGSILVLGLVIYSYVFHLSPYVGEQAVKIIPRSAETKVGEVMYNNMSYLIDVDPAKSKLLLEFFEACGFESEYNIRIDYSKNDMVNAFAVPGGQIVVFEGLINETECWDELAALMGHELAHVNERHSFKQLARSVTSYLLLSVLTGDVAGASTVLLENANQMHEMANSRAHETEADLVGLDYLKASKIRPQAMMDLFSRLMESQEDVIEEVEEELDQELPKGMDKNMEYLSTHPLTANRINYIEELISSDDSFNYQHADIPRAQEIWSELKGEIADSPKLELLKKIKEKLRLEDKEEVDLEEEVLLEEQEQ